MKTIPGIAPAYRVSARGVVFGPFGRLKTSPSDSGYACVKLFDASGRRVTRRVHVLVALAWIGPPPSSEHRVAHVDGDKSNNAADNLAWKTHAENEADKKLHGTTPKGGRVWRPNEARVLRIRERAAAGVSFSTIAHLEGLHRSSVARIVKRQRRGAVVSATPTAS